MPSLDLRSFVARTAALVDASPPTTLRETRRWLVEPFLETLGWDLRDASCVTDRAVDETRLEYVPTIDSVPALFVAVEPSDESLDESRANDLRQAMAWTGVDRAIYTNGRAYLFLAGRTDIEYRAFELSDLPNEEAAIATYSRDAVGRRLEQHSRPHIARQLAVERSRLVDDIVDRLTEATVQGEVYADEFASATDRFLDRLLVAFADGDSVRPGADTDIAEDVSVRFSESAITDDGRDRLSSTDPSASASSAAGSESSSIGREDETTETETGSENGTGTSTNPTASAADQATDGDARDDSGGAETDPTGSGEYVVRFFNERGSIGAIGHSTPEGALVGTAEYLLGRGLAGVSVPWSPDDADRTVLNDEPTRADGSPMDAPKRLSNGLALETAGDVDDQAARVEALADRAGLRAMLTGDWKTI